MVKATGMVVLFWLPFFLWSVTYIFRLPVKSAKGVYLYSCMSRWIIAVCLALGVLCCAPVSSGSEIKNEQKRSTSPGNGGSSAGPA